MSGKEKDDVCSASAVLCPTAVGGELLVPHGPASENRGRDFRLRPWGTVSLSALGVTVSGRAPSRRDCEPLGLCEEAPTSPAGAGARAVFLLALLPGGLWVTGRT